MGFFDALTQNMNLDQSFMKGADYRMLMQRHEYEKGLKAQEMALEQERAQMERDRLQMQKEAAQRLYNDAMIEKNNAVKLTKGIRAAQTDKKAKSVKTADELAMLPTTDNLLSRGGGYVVPRIPLETPEDILSAMSLAGGAGEQGKAMLPFLTKMAGDKMPLSEIENQQLINLKTTNAEMQSRINENKAQEQAITAKLTAAGSKYKPADVFREYRLEKERIDRHNQNLPIGDTENYLPIPDVDTFVQQFLDFEQKVNNPTPKLDTSGVSGDTLTIQTTKPRWFKSNAK